MLKWTVGQRSASTSSCESTPNIACCTTSYAPNRIIQTPTPAKTKRHSVSSRRRTLNKENGGHCRRSLERELMKKVASPKTNEVSSIPFRDVSNQLSPDSVENKEKWPVKRKRSKKSPRKLAFENDVRLTEKRKQPCVSEESHLIPSEENLPCKMRCKGIDEYVETSILIENRTQLTIQTSPLEEPDQMFHKELPKEGWKEDINPLRNPIVSKMICDSKGMICDVSPLARRLAWLRLGTKMTAPLIAPTIAPIPDIIPVPNLNTVSTPVKSPITELKFDNIKLDIINASSLSGGNVNSNKRKLLPDELNDSKRRCIVMNDENFSPIDFQAPSTLKRQKVIRKKNVLRKTTSCLTLPDGIPSPCDVGPINFPPVSPEKSETVQNSFSDYLLQDTTFSTSSTWDSHRKNFVKIPPLLENSSLTSLSSSKNDFHETSSTSSSQILQTSSPLMSVEKNSRSRRCLFFASPNGKTSTRATGPNFERGELDLELSFNDGVLTIYVKRGRELRKQSQDTIECNAYVKVNLVPTETRCFHRTCVRKDSCNPKFYHKFSLQISEKDLEKYVLISVWHRDRNNRKSEFLGCVSFAVINTIKKDINGTFRLQSQKSKCMSPYGYTPNDIMANQSDSCSNGKCNSGELRTGCDFPTDRMRSMVISRKDIDRTGNEDIMFLQHLELDQVGSDVENRKGGRTPFTTTHKLTKQPGSSFGFSIAWTRPPRVERVESNTAAEIAGLRSGDFIVFVNKYNVVMLEEEEILSIIRECKDQLVLEIYRRIVMNGGNRVHNVTLEGRGYSTETMDTNETIIKRKLNLPEITFNNEAKLENFENARQQTVYHLLKREHEYVLSLQFGIGRFLLPLAERKDILKPQEHCTLFQNTQEILRITEDILEQLIQEEGDYSGASIGKIYSQKLVAMNMAYRRYCSGLKKADCILVEKTRDENFMQLVTEPPIPKKRPDLITFIHKPLEHYRDILKLLQTVANHRDSPAQSQNNQMLPQVIHELQMTYREVTLESGLMEPEAYGRPLLTLQDLESRLVFTRCKPFVLNIPGRKWIFGGDLSRVEIRPIRTSWVLLFSDLLLFTKVNRDRVVFVTEEPIPLASIIDTQFNIKKRVTEFRLVVNSGITEDNLSDDDRGVVGCVSLVHFHSPLLNSRHHKEVKKKTLQFRAPSLELKAVWQNLIQRQLIKINTTGHGITPVTSPESPNPPTVDSFATFDTSSTTHKRLQMDKKLKQLIEHKCRQIGKCSDKAKAYHLAQWIKGELNKEHMSQSESEPETSVLEIWSQEALNKRTTELKAHIDQTGSYCEEMEITDDDSTSTGTNEEVSICEKCHSVCTTRTTDEKILKSDAFLDYKLNETSVVPTLLSPAEPFNPIPNIAITPPDSPHSNQPQFSIQVMKQIKLQRKGKESIDFQEVLKEDDDTDDETSDDIFPYHPLTASSKLRRYASIASLDKLSDDETNFDLIADTADEDSGIQSWACRAGSFVAQKVLEIGQNVQPTFLERYLRMKTLSPVDAITNHDEEYENSAGTSGDEIWGTPNSGGASPNEKYTLSPEEDEDDTKNDMEEILLNHAAGLPLLHNITPNRLIKNATRLETLPEDEEEYAQHSSSICSSSNSPSNSHRTMSWPTQLQDSTEKDSQLKCGSPASLPRSIFSKLILRRSQSADSPERNNIDQKSNGFPNKSFEMKNEKEIKRKLLVRMFSREHENYYTQQTDGEIEEKSMDKKFWRHLRMKRKK